MTDQGIFLIASLWSAAPSDGEDHRAGKRSHADVDAEKQHADQQRRDHGDGDHVAPVELDVFGLVLDRDRRARLEQLEAAEERVAAKRDRGMGREVGPVGKPLVAGQADLHHQPVDDDAGRRERRECARLRAVADHDDHQECRDGRASCDRHRHRPEQRGGRHVARSHRRERASEHEEHDRNEAGVAAAHPHRAMRDTIERAILLRLREQQRHAGQREEERNGKAGDDVVQRHAAHVHTDDPRQRERQDADVQLRETTNEDGDDERRERDVSEVHSPAESARDGGDDPPESFARLRAPAPDHHEIVAG